MLQGEVLPPKNYAIQKLKYFRVSLIQLCFKAFTTYTYPGHNSHFLILCWILFLASRCWHLLSWGPLTREGCVGCGYNQRSCGKMTGQLPCPHTTIEDQNIHSKLLQQHSKQKQQTTRIVCLWREKGGFSCLFTWNRLVKQFKPNIFSHDMHLFISKEIYSRLKGKQFKVKSTIFALKICFQ